MKTMTHTVKTREWEVGKIVSGVLFHSLLSRERDSLILQRVKNVATADASGEKEREGKSDVYCVASHGNVGEKA